MRILMLADRMESGGAETHVECLATELTRLGYEVEVLSGGGGIADRMERSGIVQRRYLWSDRPVVCHLRARRVLKKAMQEHRFDVLHAHTRRSAFLLRDLRLFRPRVCKKALTVVTIHAAFSCTPLLRRLSYWGDRTIAVSEDLRARVCDLFGVSGEAVSVIPNGVDPQIFYPPARPAPAETVLFASRLDGDCSLGAEWLCKIAPDLRKSYPALQIRIAGGGERLDFLRVSAMEANRLCGAETVRLLGNVEDMAAEYRRHAIFVGVSRAAVEAAMSGCCVVLCGNEGWGGVLSSESLIPAVSNFCCRGEGEACEELLLSALRELLGDRQLRAVMAASARQWMLRDYTSRAMAKAVARIYGNGKEISDGSAL